ncbi:hypothetical protein ACH4GM_41125 [Streptomyces coeruleorubidus]|uniref:hypothetical protein n=1 Tax=Streptomyces coeruleorubidus TaxID=116188 RepID=UPI00378F13A2
MPRSQDSPLKCSERSDNGRTAAAGAALDALTGTHRQLRDEHHELSGNREELSTGHQELERTQAALVSEHGALRTEHGRLRERPRRCASAWRSSPGRGPPRRTRTHREELRDTIGRLTNRLDDERTQHRREMGALRAQLDAARAAAEPAAAVDPGGEPGPDPDEPESADGEQETAGSEHGRSAPVAIVDLGVHGGSGWTLVRYEDTHSRWLVLRDGEIAGSIQPEHSLHDTSLVGRSARTSHAMPLHPPHGQKHFANREQAAGAVIR